MNMLPFVLAKKNIVRASGERSIALMIKLCFGALTLSTFGLALTVAIMNGFQHETSKKLQHVHADITITTSHGDALDSDKLISTLLQEFPQEVVAISPRAYHSLLLYNSRAEAFSTLCACIGTDAQAEEQLDTLTPYLIDRTPLSEQLSGNRIAIGKTLAATLGVVPGDEITLLYVPQEITQKKIRFEESNAVIGGVFDTGIDEFDTNMVYLSLVFFEQLFPDKFVTELAVRRAPAVALETLKDKLTARLPGLRVNTWKDLYPALVGALVLEKYAAFLVLSLVVLIAAINMLALIFMYTMHKRQDIVVLKALGMPDSHIQQMFVILSLLISVPAAALGLLLAGCASWLLEQYPIISLPDIYYVDHLPAHLDAPLVGTIFVMVILFSTVAAYIPTRRIRQFSVVHMLKFGME